MGYECFQSKEKVRIEKKLNKKKLFIKSIQNQIKASNARIKAEIN